MVSKVLFSSNKEDWGTPPEIWNSLNGKYEFQLDAATSKDNPLGTKYFYTSETDGLNRSNKWYNPTYINPPYGRGIMGWVERANEEQLNGITTVMLLPARTDTKWFHEFVYNNSHVKYLFLRGRLKMFNHESKCYSKNSAPFPSMIVYFFGEQS